MPEKVRRKEMTAHIWPVFKWCWLACSVGLLLLTLSIYDGTPATRDAELVLLYGMLFLCFPVSQLVALVFWLICLLIAATMHEFSIPVSYSTLVIEWLVLFIAGYFQWFVLLPWLWRKWKARRAGGAAPSV
jgi:hypothetical protein